MVIFGIVCVTHSTDPNRIYGVGVYDGDSNSVTHLRSKVISNIDAGHTYRAWVKKNGNWIKGAQVEKTPDGKFITTNPNHTTSDNLGNLPVCGN